MARTVPLVEFSISKSVTTKLTTEFSGLSGFLQAQLTPLFVAQLREFLVTVAEQGYSESGIRTRTGRMKRDLMAGIRTRGSSRFNQIYGAIIVEPYIAAHEFGADIFPKNAKYLALPLPAALRSDGTPKRRGPRSWQSLGTFIHTAKNKRKYIVYKRSSGELVFLYVLVDRVELPARLRVVEKYNELLSVLYSSWGETLIAAFAEFDLIKDSPKYVTPAEARTKIRRVAAAIRVVRPRL